MTITVTKRKITKCFDDDGESEEAVQERVFEINTDMIIAAIQKAFEAVEIERLKEQHGRFFELVDAFCEHVASRIIKFFEALYWFMHPVRVVTDSGLRYDIRQMLVMGKPTRYIGNENIASTIRRQLLPRWSSKESDHNDLTLR